MSNLLITVYYDDSAQYFKSFEECLEEEDINITYLCHNLSAYLYLKFHSQYNCFYLYSWRTRVDYLKLRYFAPNGGIELPPYLKGIIKSQRQTVEWAAEHNAIIKFYKRERTKVDYAIFSGQDRLLEWSLSQHIERKVFFEQGPFNTSTLTDSGVNANLVPSGSMRKYFTKQKIDLQAYFERSDKIKRSPLYRVVDFLNYAICFAAGCAFPSEKLEFLAFSNKFKRLINLKKKLHDNSDRSKEKNILLVLQVQFDVNNVLHTPDFKLSDILSQLVKGSNNIANIRVRLHPLETTTNALKQKTAIAAENLQISHYSLDDDLSWGDIVVTSNSTVGIEAVQKGLDVICYGESYWQSLPNVARARNLEDISRLVNSKLQSSNASKVERSPESLETFLRERFVPGHFRHHNVHKRAVAGWLIHLLKGSK